MATLRANGGVIRRWVSRRNGYRLALCANGQFLLNKGGVWRRWREPGTVLLVERDGQWQEVTTLRWPTWR